MLIVRGSVPTAGGMHVGNSRGSSPPRDATHPASPLPRLSSATRKSERETPTEQSSRRPYSPLRIPVKELAASLTTTLQERNRHRTTSIGPGLSCIRLHTHRSLAVMKEATRKTMADVAVFALSQVAFYYAFKVSHQEVS